MRYCADIIESDASPGRATRVCPLIFGRRGIWENVAVELGNFLAGMKGELIGGVWREKEVGMVYRVKIRGGLFGRTSASRIFGI